MKTPIPKNDSLKIIQISDTHLFSTDELELFGTKSNLIIIYYKIRKNFGKLSAI